MAASTDLKVVVGADLSQFQREMSKLEKDIGKIGNRLSGIGEKLTVGLSVPLLGIGIAASKMSMDFNAGMADVATLIPGNIQRVNELKKSIREMQVETGKGAQDLTGGLYQVISAFGDTAETAEVLKINAKAAAAGLATTTDAINLTSAVTKGYGDTSAKAVKKVSDLAFQTVKLGQTTFPELASSMGRVTPLAASLGVSMEDMFGVMATGTGVTGDAAEVSTQLRGILQSLMAPTETMAALYQQMGFESGQAMIQQLGLQGTINAIVKAAQESGEPLQKFIGSIEGQTLALALAGPQADVLTKKIQEMGTATGATDAAFKEQTEGVNEAGFKWAQFQQKVAVTAETLGDQLAPQLNKVFDSLQPVINSVMSAVSWFANLDSGTQTFILSAILLVASLGPVILVLGKIITTIGALIPIVKQLGVAFIWLKTNPIGLILTGLALLVTAGITLYNNWDTVKEKILAIWDAIKEGIKSAVNAIIRAFNKMIEGMNRISFSIPDWVPEIGGKSWGFNIPTIPYLAKGGVVSGPTLAMIGEGRQDEAVAPIDTLFGMIQKAVLSTGQQGTGQVVNNYFGENSVVVPAKDLEEVMTTVRILKELRQTSRSYGSGGVRYGY